MDTFRLVEKESIMARARRTYTPEFRHNVLELIRSGRSANAVAREYEISRQTITKWLKQDDLDAGRRSDGLTTVESAESRSCVVRCANSRWSATS